MFVGQATHCMMACVHSSPCPHVLPPAPISPLSTPCQHLAWASTHLAAEEVRWWGGEGESLMNPLSPGHNNQPSNNWINQTAPDHRLIPGYEPRNRGCPNIPSHLSLDTASAWPLLLALLFRHFKRMDITYSDLFGYFCKQKYICGKTLDVKCLKGFIEWFLCLEKFVQSHPLNGEDEDTSSSLWLRG